MATRRKASGDVASNPPKTIDGEMFYGMRLDEDQERFANAIWNPEIDIVFCNSIAGAGKTTIATGVANLLTEYKMFSNIVYVISPYGERKQGWLPGTLTEKSSVYFDAFYQALVTCGVNPHSAVTSENMSNQKNGSGYISCLTDTFLRGINISDTVLIVDEAQNCTLTQLKTILTRVTDNTKVIVIGHELQCDLDDPTQSGFAQYIEHFKGKDRAAVCKLTHNHRGWISRHADLLRFGE